MTRNAGAWSLVPARAPWCAGAERRRTKVVRQGCLLTGAGIDRRRRLCGWAAGLMRHRLGARVDFALVDLGLSHRSAPSPFILGPGLRHSAQIVPVVVNLRAAGVPRSAGRAAAAADRR